MKSLMDYIKVRGRVKGKVVNCKLILGEACVKQHRLVVMDFEMRGRKPKKRKRRSKIRIWYLKGEKCDHHRRNVRERQRERSD